MEAWKLALIVAFVGMSLGWMFYTPPTPPDSIKIDHKPPPERMIMEPSL